MPRFASNRLDRTVLASLAAFLGHRPTILAWASTADGWVIGSPGAMLLGDGESWHSFPWHQVTSGQWDHPSSRLSWLDADGVHHEVVLEGGGRFADLFNERVSASVVVSRRAELSAGRHVTLALRRNLEPGSDQTAWQVVPGAGVDLDHPATRAQVDQELAAAQTDFGLA
ncbi:MAG: hypothetical protein KIT69_11920 [Propionibacteriaceae bacterium]|nr:hypothetical protein [Propionibacteriaceae bacterium]